MTFNIIVILILSIIVAIGLSYIQYLYKNKFSKIVSYTLFGLRWLSYMSVFVLLINPIISRKNTEIQKPIVAIYVDNSLSIKELKATETTQAIIKKLKENNKLKEKYAIQFFQFDEQVATLENVNFLGTQTRLDKVVKNNNQLFRNQHPIILLSDGNQTIGEEYVYGFNEKTTVFPIVLGDTTAVFDLKIQEVTTNKIAFLKNKFPVEIFVQKSGNQSVSSNVSIFYENSKVFTQNILFSKTETSKNITALIEASKIGIQKYKIAISSNISEKNTVNNSKPLVIEVVDQRSEIALISAINHPDLGVIKRSIESNPQQNVTFLKPSDVIDYQKYNLFIFNQPNSSFLAIFKFLQQQKKNVWILTGTQTDYDFLNAVAPEFSFKMSNQKEEYFSEYKDDFSVYAQENIGFENFPPLQNLFGNITPKVPNFLLLSAKVNGVSLQNPILTFTEVNNQRKAFLFGENLWKWRMQSHITQKSFADFDGFIGKIIQFLNSKNANKPLQVEAENFYNLGEPIELKAQYFTKNLEFDEKANLTIVLENKTTKQLKKYDFIQKNGYFSVSFNDLAAGIYAYKVVENNSKTTVLGSFEILNFSAEQQFVNADKIRLEQVANQTNGEVFYPNQIEILTDKLLQSTNYQPIEKNITKKTPLIDWVWILIILALSLASEWFIRKYNGLL